MKRSFTKIVSVLLTVILGVAVMSCAAAAKTVVDGCSCACCMRGIDNGFQGPRDIYLVLDVSGSMSGTPITKLKAAAKQFCKDVLEDKTGYNRIAVVTYATTANAATSFSDNYNALAAVIDGLTAKGSTAMYDALMLVKDIDEKIGNDEATKHVVVMADGLPNEGATLTSGQYTSRDSSMYYKFGNAVYSTAAGMWYDYSIYSIGFFHNLGGSQLEFGQVLMDDIQNTLYLEVFNPEELMAAFTGVADAILGECICEKGCDCGTEYGCCDCCVTVTEKPTTAPTEAPTAAPTEAPTAAPTEAPTAAPTTAVQIVDQTGDSSVGLVIACVAMLSGIAVVVTKKREG